MSPETIIRKASVDGVKLSLSPAGTIKATGDSSALHRWMDVIREHKSAIVETLAERDESQSSNPEQQYPDGPSWCWWLAFSETEHLLVYFHPEATRAEVLERYPGVLVAEPYTPAADSHPHPETDERNQEHGQD